jgi:hypothetical protein
MWPAEWAVSHSFWREVATRTVAGILSLVFLGIPGVIYAVSFGALTTEQGWLIGIGLALVVVLIALYLAFLGISQALALRAERRASAQASTRWTPQRIRFIGKLNEILAIVAALVSTALAGTTAFEAFEIFFP